MKFLNLMTLGLSLCAYERKARAKDNAQILESRDKNQESG
jgi:hypothetical protein